MKNENKRGQKWANKYIYGLVVEENIMFYRG